MRPIRLPIADLVRRRAGTRAGRSEGAHDRLTDIAAFGPDPGNLRMRVFLPAGLPAGAPLLVALHGCTQTASGFDHGCGWSDVAAAHGFALLLPEQRRANNAGGCFNWFEPGDTTRGQGEVESIRATVAHLSARHALDPTRVFVTGLSAGGAMAGALLATCPDVFAAGAVVAGLPYGAASGLQQALGAMAGAGNQDAAALLAFARAAAPPGTTRWPRLTIWQGEADTTVRPANAELLAAQWTGLHGLDPARPTQDGALEPPGAGRRRTWRNAAGEPVVELNTLAGLDHGVPISPGVGPGHVGRTMPFILDAGVPAPLHIAAFFGLVPPLRPRADGVITVGADGVARAETPEPSPWTHPGAAIRRALRAVGLME